MTNTTIKPVKSMPAMVMRNASWSGRISLFFAGLYCVLVPLGQAQTTVTIANPIPVIFGGAGVTNLYPGYTNSQVTFTLAGGTDPVNLFVNVVGNPAGVTAGFVTNGTAPNSATNISTLLTVTSTIKVFLSVAVTNAPKGLYPLQLIASNTLDGLTYTDLTTVLVLPDVFIANTNITTDTNWSDANNWSLGAPPATGDDARFEFDSPRALSTYFDTSVVLDSLEMMPQTDNLNTIQYFAPGVTVAVNGTNGFWAGADDSAASGLDARYNFTFTGYGGALVVTNPQAPFSMYSMINDGGSSRSIQNMSGLGNLYADVELVGVGDGFLTYPKLSGTQPAENGTYYLAQTNFIRATYVGDYSGDGFMTNSIMFLNAAGNGNGNYASEVLLGISNVFYADSFSVISHEAADSTTEFLFNPAFSSATNSYVPVAVFRGTNGGRMSYFGVGVESGGSGYTGRTRGSGAILTGGIVDMMVDTLVLGQNQTNRNGNYAQGVLSYNKGTVNANTVRVGYQAPNGGFIPVNVTGVRGTCTVGGVGSNAVMNVNQLLSFTQGTFTDVPANVYGQFIIGNGGNVYVNSVNCGPGSTSYINIQNGGQLTLTNTMCSPSAPLPTLTLATNAQLNLIVTAGVTNIYVTNYSDSLGAIINITALNGFSPSVAATNVLISYVTPGTHHVALGTLPANYNALLYDDTAHSQIELILSPHVPQVLRWMGYVNNVWDHTTANWQNTNTLQQVTFFDGDSVIFDDSVGVPTTISVADTEIPNTAGTGIYMTNGTSDFTLANGGGSIGTCSMVKVGGAGLVNNEAGTANLQLTAGTITGSGGVGSLVISSNAVMSYSGQIAGAFAVDGGGVATLLPGGLVSGSLTVQGNGVFTNSGTVQGGSMTVAANGLLVNTSGGWLYSVGDNAVVSGTLLNIGNIGDDAQANVITVNGTFRDMGVGQIYISLLTFNSGSTFWPGGNGVGTTTINNPGVDQTYNGRLQMLAGSTTVIQVDFSNPQTNTQVISQFTDYGANESSVAYNGCTILMTNINPGAGSFAVGQSFQVFSGFDGFNTGNEGLNTTNVYPIMSPTMPNINTLWDLSNLRLTTPNGIIDIDTNPIPTTATNFTSFASTNDGNGNIVTYLQWPSNYTGWTIEEQTNTLAVGLTNATSAWVRIAGSKNNSYIYITNNMNIPASFFRMVYP